MEDTKSKKKVLLRGRNLRRHIDTQMGRPGGETDTEKDMERWRLRCQQ